MSIEEMCGLLRGKLKKKEAQIKKALVGNFQEHHKFMIEASLKHIKSLKQIISEIDLKIDNKLENYRKEYELLQTIPGVKENGAASLIAEIGADMDVFPTPVHLSSWAGVSPGNNENAGKKNLWNNARKQIVKGCLGRMRLGGDKDERHLFKSEVL